jgi:hypothetical protein
MDYIWDTMKRNPYNRLADALPFLFLVSFRESPVVMCHGLEDGRLWDGTTSRETPCGVLSNI